MPFPANLDLSMLDGVNGFTISGAAVDDGSGFSVASAGRRGDQRRLWAGGYSRASYARAHRFIVSKKDKSSLSANSSSLQPKSEAAVSDKKKSERISHMADARRLTQA